MVEELKIYIDSPEEIEQKLLSIGAKFVRELQITDTYFNQPGMVLKLTEDESGSLLTQLQSKDGGFQFIKEEKISDPEVAKRDLEKQHGINCVLKKKKRFWDYKNYDISLNLFEDIGNFLIVEGETVKPEIFTDTLGISNPRYLTKSFAQLKSELSNKKPGVILSDLGAVLLFPKDRTFSGKLNPVYDEEVKKENFNFFDHFEINSELLDYYLSLKNKGIKIYMITEGTIQNDPAIKEQLDSVFIKIFSGKDFGLSKKDPQLYINLIQEIGETVDNVLYVDDSSDNCNAARASGMKICVYESNEKATKYIDSQLKD